MNVGDNKKHKFKLCYVALFDRFENFESKMHAEGLGDA
jgi:hypothetical protein